MTDVGDFAASFVRHMDKVRGVARNNLSKEK